MSWPFPPLVPPHWEPVGIELVTFGVFDPGGPRRAWCLVERSSAGPQRRLCVLEVLA